MSKLDFKLRIIPRGIRVAQDGLQTLVVDLYAESLANGRSLSASQRSYDDVLDVLLSNVVEPRIHYSNELSFELAMYGKATVVGESSSILYSADELRALEMS
jgi:hypothetical protein